MVTFIAEATGQVLLIAADQSSFIKPKRFTMVTNLAKKACDINVGFSVFDQLYILFG